MVSAGQLFKELLAVLEIAGMSLSVVEQVTYLSDRLSDAVKIALHAAGLRDIQHAEDFVYLSQEEVDYYRRKIRLITNPELN